MKRIWIGIGILLGLFVLGILVMELTDQRLGEVSDQLRQAATEPNWQEAVTQAQAAREHWKQHWYLSASLSDHSNIDQIDAAFAQLKVYQQYEDVTAHAATCAWLSEAVEDLEETQRLSWWNFL